MMGLSVIERSARLYDVEGETFSLTTAENGGNGLVVFEAEDAAGNTFAYAKMLRGDFEKLVRAFLGDESD